MPDRLFLMTQHQNRTGHDVHCCCCVAGRQWSVPRDHDKLVRAVPQHAKCRFTVGLQWALKDGESYRNACDICLSCCTKTVDSVRTRMFTPSYNVEVQRRTLPAPPWNMEGVFKSLITSPMGCACSTCRTGMRELGTGK